MTSTVSALPIDDDLFICMHSNINHLASTGSTVCGASLGLGVCTSIGSTPLCSTIKDKLCTASSYTANYHTDYFNASDERVSHGALPGLSACTPIGSTPLCSTINVKPFAVMLAADSGSEDIGLVSAPEAVADKAAQQRSLLDRPPRVPTAPATRHGAAGASEIERNAQN
jgi:hypothetical protein